MPDTGSVELALRRSKVVPLVFQDYRRSLLPWLDAKANILYPLRLAGLSARVQVDRFEKLVSLIQPTFDLHQRVSELSGGEAQLTSLLRALIVEPEILVCDEPTSALDYQASVTLVHRLMEAARQFELTVVFVGHDLDEVLYVGDEVVFLSRRPGRVVGQLPVNLPRPRHISVQTSSQFAALKSEALTLFDRCLTVDSGPAVNPSNL